MLVSDAGVKAQIAAIDHNKLAHHVDAAHYVNPADGRSSIC